MSPKNLWSVKERFDETDSSSSSNSHTDHVSRYGPLKLVTQMQELDLKRSSDSHNQTLLKSVEMSHYSANASVRSNLLSKS